MGGGGSVAPRDMKLQIGKWAPHLSGFAQQDCQEFMRFLLDGLAEDLNRSPRPPIKPKEKERKSEKEKEAEKERQKQKDREEEERRARMSEEEEASEMWSKHCEKNDSVINDLFCGQLRSQVQCTTCQHISRCFDPCLDVSIPIPKVRPPACLPCIGFLHTYTFAHLN